MTQKSKDIQPQAEAYIVKSHDIHIDADYADWIAGTMHRYLFCAKNIEKLHLRGAEKMHQVGAELQFAVNHFIMSQAKNNWLSVYVSCRKSCKKKKRLMSKIGNIENK